MTKAELFDYVKEVYSTLPDYPWDDENVVLRHKENKKWYAAVLRVNKQKLGLSSDEMTDVLNLKCDPILIGSLLSQNGFHRAYHMNKDKWISLRLDGSVSDDDIKYLLDLSFKLTLNKK